MYFKKRNYMLIVLFLTFLFILPFSKQTIVSAAEGDLALPNIPIQYPDTQDAPDTDSWPPILDSTNQRSDLPGVYPSEKIIPYQYSFSPSLSYNTKYYRIEPDGSEKLQTSGNSGSLTTKTSFRVTNVGFYNKRAIDLIYTVLDDVTGYQRNSKGQYTNLNTTLYFSKVTKDMNDTNLQKAQDALLYTQSNFGDPRKSNDCPVMVNTIQYVYHDNETNVNKHEKVGEISGIINNGRLSNPKSLYLDPEYYVGGRSAASEGQKKQNVYFKTSNGSLWISNTMNTAISIDDPDTEFNRFTELFHSQNGEVKITQRRSWAKRKIIRHSLQSETVSPVQIKNIEVLGAKNENIDDKNLISWTVRQTFPAQPQNRQLDNYYYLFKVPKAANLDISKLTIKDNIDRDLSNQFNVVYNSENSTVAITAKNTSKLLNNTIDFNFVGTINPHDSNVINNYLKNGYVEMNGDIENGHYGIAGENYQLNTDSDKSQTRLNIFPSNPKLDKAVTNERPGGTDGKYRVGDSLTYSLTARNNSVPLVGSILGSSWNNVIIKDKIPEGLALDLSSLRIKGPNDSTEKNIDPSKIEYDENSGHLSINTELRLGDSQQLQIFYKTKILESGGGKDLVNSAEADGMDTNILTPTQKKAFANKSIHVEPNLVNANFEKKVRNITADKNSLFEHDVQGTYNDLFEFEINFKLNENSKAIPNGSILSDKLDKGLSLSSDEPILLKITKTDGSTSNEEISDLEHAILPKLSSGDSFTLKFKATISQEIPDVIPNKAEINYVDKDDGKSKTLVTNETKITPKDFIGFVSVPSKINFGIHTPYTMKKIENVSTELNGNESNTLKVIDYSNDPNYDVKVSYDNNGLQAMKNDENDKLPASSSNSNLLSFKQDNAEHPGKPIPLTSIGISVKNGGFNKYGINDLTDLVGKNKWQLETDGSVINNGTYSGSLTWTIQSSI